MAIDYSKKKNVELEELLKGRSLPHTGKKADLIARLQDDDAKKSVVSPTSSKPTASAKPVATTVATANERKPLATAPATAAEDEIDWDEDDNLATTVPTVTTKSTKEPAPAASHTKVSTSASTSRAKPSSVSSAPTSKPAAATIAAGGLGPVSTPAAVPNQVVAIDPSNTHDLSVKLPDSDASSPAALKKPSEEAAPNKEYSLNLPPTSLEIELAKRAKRAALWKTGPFDAPIGDDAKPDTTAKEKNTTKDATPVDASKKTSAGAGGAAKKESQAEIDARKAKERAKRFATEKPAVKASEEALPQASSVKGLDEALLTERAVRGLDEPLPQRGVKRGRDNGEDGGRGGKRGRRNDGGARRDDGGRRDNGGRNNNSINGGGRGRRDGGRRGAEADGRKGGNGRGGNGRDKRGPALAAVAAGDKAALREKDRVAAEARKKKFGPTTTTAT